MIFQPQIDKDSLRTYAELETDPLVNIEIVEDGISPNYMDDKIIAHFDILARKMARYYIDQKNKT